MFDIQKLVWLTLSLALLGCAERRYLNPTSNGGGGTIEQKLSGCMSTFSGGQCVSFAFEGEPVDGKLVTFLFKVFRKNNGDGSPVPIDLPGDIDVVLWMPSMGHGSSPVTVEKLDVGTYRASRVFFSMKGDWDLRFQLKVGGDVRDQAIISIIL
jgi:hypothetical protein